MLDTALSSALLAQVAEGAPLVFRLARPGPTASFSRRDRLAPGFENAVASARRAGFTPVMRVGGGRPAVVHEDAILFGLAEPAAQGATERFEAMADLVRATLRRLGIDAATGELPGEYCPGRWSLHAGGIKLAGIAQRVTRGAAWTEGFLMARGGERVRNVLTPVYAALDLAWDPSTAGATDDLVPSATWEAAAAAMRGELGALAPTDLDPATLALAQHLRSRHDPAAG